MFVLIAAVVIGFTYFSSKKEDKEQQPPISSTIEDVRIQDNTTEQPAPTEPEKANTPAPTTADADAPTTEPKQLTLAEQFFGTPRTAVNAGESLNEEAAPQIITLENEKIKIDFSTLGGQMLSAKLKDYHRFDDDSLPLTLFEKDAKFALLLRNRSGRAITTDALLFTPIYLQDGDKQSITMRYAHSADQYVDFVYTLSTDDYMMKFDVALVGMEEMLYRETVDYLEMYWAQDQRRQEKSRENEQRHSKLIYKFQGDDVAELKADKNERKTVTEAPTKWVAFKDQFFATVLIADNQFKEIDVESKILLNSDKYLKTYAAKMYAPVVYNANSNTLKAGFRYYLGPLQFSNLQSYDDGIKDASQQLDLDKLVYLGWSLFRIVNKYFVIPIFNLLGSTGLSMGLVILLLTIIVKLLVSPLTYKSFMSSAKMRVLRPQVEELAAKYPKQEQAMEKQQATMALYRKAGVNPMSGCIPMLAQMPLLIALFQFFPSAIELRQQSFLWATDLSTYDAIIEWGTSIPLIGTHISLFCILMTITNVIYTKFNMQMTDTGSQMPGMKWMMYLMPVIFLFVLNDYPSGLTYYYFLSLLITILLTISFRYFVDEKKLLAKLEANKAKPKKKSGFMARLEEAQRMQQQQMKNQKKKK